MNLFVFLLKHLKRPNILRMQRASFPVRLATPDGLAVSRLAAGKMAKSGFLINITIVKKTGESLAFRGEPAANWIQFARNTACVDRIV